MPGPIPDREANLARPRSRKGKDQVPVTRGVARKVSWPRADQSWHPLAIDLYNAAKKSGQSDFYQQSDIALLYSLCEDLSHYKNSYKRSGQMLATIMQALTSLLITEGERRRVRIELMEPEPETKPASVVAIASYREALGVAE